MKHSESIVNISKALVEAQKEFYDPKQSAENPFFKSSYTPLVDILKMARPILNKHKIMILQNIDGLKVSTMLLHESGEWIEQDGIELEAEKNTPQSGGSAITYARRYSLSAWLGISSEEDDDANLATHKGNKPKKTENKTNEASPESQDVTDRKQAAKEQYNKFWNSLEDGYKFELKDMTDEERYKLFVKCNWNVAELDAKIIARAKSYTETQADR